MKAIIFYSGSAGFGKDRLNVAEPETVLGDDANLMLSYSLIRTKKQDQHIRFPGIHEARTHKGDEHEPRQ